LLPCRLPLPEVEFPEGNRSISPIAPPQGTASVFTCLSKQFYRSQYCLSIKHCQVADGSYVVCGLRPKSACPKAQGVRIVGAKNKPAKSLGVLNGSTDLRLYSAQTEAAAPS
jgi:hypothetical protein